MDLHQHLKDPPDLSTIQHAMDIWAVKGAGPAERIHIQGISAKILVANSICFGGTDRVSLLEALPPMMHSDKATSKEVEPWTSLAPRHWDPSQLVLDEATVQFHQDPTRSGCLFIAPNSCDSGCPFTTPNGGPGN